MRVAAREDHQGCVEHRQAQHEDGYHPGDLRRVFEARLDAERSEKPMNNAPVSPMKMVAASLTCRENEIVAEEAQRRAQEGRRRLRHQVLAIGDGQQEEEGRGDRGDAGRQTVHVV